MLKRLRTRAVRTTRSTAPNGAGEPVEEPEAPSAASWLPPESADDSDRERRIADERALWLAAAPLAGNSSSTPAESERDAPSSWLLPSADETPQREPVGQREKNAVGQERTLEPEPADEPAATDWLPGDEETTLGREPAAEADWPLEPEPAAADWLPGDEKTTLGQEPAAEADRPLEREPAAADWLPTDEEATVGRKPLVARAETDEAPTRWLLPS